MAEIISASVSGNILTLVYDEAMTLANSSGASVYTSSGTQLSINGMSGDGTSTWTLTLSASISSTDYVILQSDGTIAYGTNSYQTLSWGTAFIGADGATSIDLTDVWNYNQPYSVFSNGGSDSIIVDSGEQTTYINLTESTAASDTVNFGDQWVDEDFSLLNQKPLTIDGFGVSGTSTNDKLSMVSNVIAANTSGYVDGTDAGVIASHSITSGIVTFKDSSGAVVTIDTAEKAQNAYDYLEANITAPGTTLATQVSVDGTALVVFQKGAVGVNSFAVVLDGISGVTLSTTAGTNKVQIVDTTGPEPINVVTTTNGLNLYFGESVSTASFTGLKLYKNGVTDMGTLSKSISGATVSLSSSTQTLSDTDFVVLDASATHTFTTTDALGNSWVETETFKQAQGGAGDNVINLSTLSGVTQAYGGDGNDTITGTTGDDDIGGDAGNDVLNGGTGDDYIEGGAGNDTLSGGDGNDDLKGGSGNDRLDGGAGTNNMDGGSGDDTYVLRTDTDYYWEDEDAGTDTVETYKSYTYMNSNIENANIVATGNADVYGNELDNIIYAGSGNNIINGEGGRNGVSYINATSGVTVDLSQTGSQNTVGSGYDTLSNIQDVYGSNLNDTLTVNNVMGSNIFGNAGDDTVIARSGYYSYYLDGGSGTDTISYAAAEAGVTVNLALTSAQNTGGSGTDTIVGFENLTGSNYNDTLRGNSLGNVISGLSGNDVIFASAGTATDTYDGGEGTDSISYYYATSGVNVNLSNTDYQNTGAGSDKIVNIENLYGSNYNDTLRGNTTGNSFYGNGGNDIIFAGAGTASDIFDGGTGTDSISYYYATNGVNVNLSNTGYQDTGVGSDKIVNVENLYGSNYNDTLRGNGNGNSFYGNGGNDIMFAGGGSASDIFDGGTGTDSISYYYVETGVTVDLSNTGYQYTGVGSDKIVNVENLYGSNYNDTLRGNGNGNSFYGNGGNDIMFAGGGSASDIFDGGTGTDSISYFYVETGVTVDLSNTGYQYTGVGSDKIVNVENLYGSNYNDTLRGNGNGNSFYGNGGNDIMFAGGGSASDIFDGGTGTDSISYIYVETGVTVDLSNTGFQYTGVGSDMIVNVENLYGSAYNDTLKGNSANNGLYGNNGNDTIYGGDGNDLLSGGSGLDTFVFNTALNASTNKDTIADFTAADDTIQLENAIFTALTSTGTLAAGNFAANASGTATDGDDYILYNTTTGVLSYDADGSGSGAAVEFAVLGTSTHPSDITNADFVII